MRRPVAVVAMLALACGPVTLSSLAHAGERTILSKSRFVSSGINQVALQLADGAPVGQAILIRSRAKGAWGPSETEALMQWDIDAVGFSPDCFEGGFGLTFPVVQYDFLTTYSDLSSTHGNLVEGELCVKFDDFSQTRFWFDVNVLGGTGRFAGATGVARFRGKTEALPPGRFSVSEGVVESTLALP